MKILWHRVAIIVSLISACLAWLIFYVAPFRENTCDKMIDEIKSDSRRAELMAFANKVTNKNSLKTIWNESIGTIHHHLLVDKSLYDDTLLNSLDSYPTIALYGHNIDYNDLTNSEIESIAIGLGLRAFILIDVDKDGMFIGDSFLYKQKDVKAVAEHFLVVCRSD